MSDHQDDEANRLLEGAYALQTPTDNVIYYRDFASHYDASFAGAMGYIYPGIVARALIEVDYSPGPILDVGCGTGLVAAELRAKGVMDPIDGVDLSPEMLVKAEEKALYQSLYEIDLTAELMGLPHGYAALISAGTFTHGHIGPEPLSKLIDHCQAGAIAAIGVNAVHFKALNFAAVLGDLYERERISQPVMQEVKIFDGADDAHAEDTAFVLRFTVR